MRIPLASGGPCRGQDLRRVAWPIIRGLNVIVLDSVLHALPLRLKAASGKTRLRTKRSGRLLGASWGSIALFESIQ
jgi:hypothetical protein